MPASRANAPRRTPPPPPSADSAPGGEVPNNALKAAENGRVGPVRLWLNDGGKANTIFDVEGEGGGGKIPCTLLMIAARNGHVQIVELLLKRGADINLQTSLGSSALNTAAYGGRERMVEMLLQHGAEIGTALTAAAHGGKERVVDLLLRRGAEIDLQDKDGESALVLAACFNRPAVVRRLLRAGADTAARAENGKTALQLAKEEGHAECVEAFKKHVQEVLAGRPAATAAGGRGAGGASSGGASSAGSRVATTLSPAVAAGRAPSGAAAAPDAVVAAAHR